MTLAATRSRPSLAGAISSGSALPVTVIVLIVIVVWYLAAIPMNRVLSEPLIAAAGGGLSNTLSISWSLPRPVLPAPHQVLAELWSTVFTVAPWRPRSLLYHCWVTLSSTLLGFILGTILGVALAIAIIHVKALNRSLMPWIIASQTIPILAIAPMIIVVLGAINITGLLPKSLISMYLCFFPVTIGMVKGLTSPDPMQLDLMRTYNSNTAQVLWKLRWPASLPFLFASLKVAIAIALVGAIVGELPTGAQAGIGARLLNGSYYGQTQQIWAALVAAAVMSSGLVWLVGFIERRVALAMGGRP
ncbi:MAG: ABC transporter permease [Pseudomonadota bacterium]